MITVAGEIEAVEEEAAKAIVEEAMVVIETTKEAGAIEEMTTETTGTMTKITKVIAGEGAEVATEANLADTKARTPTQTMEDQTLDLELQDHQEVKHQALVQFSRKESKMHQDV